MGKDMGRQKIIVIIAGLAAAVLIVCMFALLKGEKSQAYRSIRIVELEGEVTIERENMGNLEAAVNMNLMSGDRVSTAQGSYAVLRLDADKFVMLGESGAMEVTAEGDGTAGKTSIVLDSGSVLSEIRNPLGESSTFDIVTSNATMSARGTIFEVRNGGDGEDKVSVLVYDGHVEVALEGKEPALYEEGEYTEFAAGTSPQFLTERELITAARLNEQMYRRLQEIEADGRNINWGSVETSAGNVEVGKTPEPEVTVTPEAVSTPEASPTSTPEEAVVSTPKPTAAPTPKPNHRVTPTPAPGRGTTPVPATDTPEPEVDDWDEEDTSDDEGDSTSGEEPGTTTEPGGEPTKEPEPSGEPDQQPTKEPEPGGEPTKEPEPSTEPEEEPTKEPETSTEPEEDPTDAPETSVEPDEETTEEPEVSVDSDEEANRQRSQRMKSVLTSALI